MPYTVLSTCCRCCQTDRFIIGNWKEHLGVYRCQACRAMVNISLDTGRCPGCGRVVSPRKCYDHANAIPSLNGRFLARPQDGPICPRCDKGSLSFRPTMHHDLGHFACRRADAKRWLGKQYLEKEIFGAALLLVSARLGMNPEDAFSYFCLDCPATTTEWFLHLMKTKRGLSTPLVLDIHMHLSAQTSHGGPLSTGQQPPWRGEKVEADSVRAIRNRGATVHWNDETGHACAVQFSDDINDNDLPDIARWVQRLHTPIRLTLSHTQISDVGIAHLRHLWNVTELNLLDTQVGDAGLTLLRSLSNLTILNVTDTHVTAEGIRQFSMGRRVTVHSAFGKSVAARQPATPVEPTCSQEDGADPDDVLDEYTACLDLFCPQDSTDHQNERSHLGKGCLVAICLIPVVIILCLLA